MGIANWFSTFCTNIQVDKKDAISKRYNAITKRLNTDFWSTNSEISHSLYVGSFGRNTATYMVSDVDMIFRLPYEIYEKYNAYSSNGQSALLQTVKQSISTTYSITKVKADGQVIVVPFDDGIEFEVVPAFINKDESYTFPNSNDNGSWKTTDPLPEISAIRTRNAVCNNNLIALCRMMRQWKSMWSVPIGGLLIDTLAYNFIATWEYRDKSYFYYDFMCRDFFKWMSEQSREQSYWKAPGSGQHVYGKGLFQYKAGQCYNLACAAIEHEAADPKREWSAKQKWNEIFGAKFPS